MLMPVTRGLWKHCKGGHYFVMGLVLDVGRDVKGAGEEKVLYHDLADGQLFVRGLAEFVEPVRWPDGTTRPRFIRVPPASLYNT